MRNNEKLLLFTATYNEIRNIKIIFKEIKKLNKILDIKYDVLIVDDNSTDGTKEYLKIYEKLQNNITVIKRVSKLGLNTAHEYAFYYANKKNYKYLITFDSDLQHEIKEIPKFYKYLKINNFVIGSRYILGGKCNLKGIRLILSVYGNKIIKLLLRSSLNEYTTSFRGFDKIALKFLYKARIISTGYSFFLEVVNIMLEKKLKIKEIPINFINRKYGISKLPKIEILRTIVNLIRIYIKNYISFLKKYPFVKN
jgi:dolichol-phosphate mannosyltransferase